MVNRKQIKKDKQKKQWMMFCTEKKGVKTEKNDENSYMFLLLGHYHSLTALFI